MGGGGCEIESEGRQQRCGVRSQEAALRQSILASRDVAQNHGCVLEIRNTIGIKESVWERPAGGKYSEDIYASAHVDDCLLSCKSPDVMSMFKGDLLCRIIGTDEGEVMEYLGCELVRDRKTRTGLQRHLVQAGYAERVLRAFDAVLYVIAK